MIRLLIKARGAVSLGVIGGLVVAVIGMLTVVFASVIDSRPFVFANIIGTGAMFGSLGGAASFLFAIIVTAVGSRLGAEGLSRTLGVACGFASGAIVASGVGWMSGLPAGTIVSLAVLGGGSGSFLGVGFVVVAQASAPDILLNAHAAFESPGKFTFRPQVVAVPAGKEPPHSVPDELGPRDS